MNDDLRGLLSDAVSDVEPADRIDQLRARVRPSPKVVPMSRSRWWYAAGGIVATAAVIGAVASSTSLMGARSSRLGTATDPATALPTIIATDPSAPRVGATTPRPRRLTIYYPGHSPRGTVLFPQQTPIATGLDPLQEAVARLMAQPYDPDYRIGWAPGWLSGAELQDGVIRVELGDVPAARPERMSARTASEVVESAVYTLEAAARSSAAVVFVRSGAPVARVLGVPTSYPLTPQRSGDVLARIAISRPVVDGRHAARGRLVVSGTDARALGGVVVRLERTTATGTKVVRTTDALSGGVADQSGRYSWRAVLETSRLRPGTYTVTAHEDAGPAATDTDTRVVVLR